jgi:hypothetical protein
VPRFAEPGHRAGNRHGMMLGVRAGLAERLDLAPDPAHVAEARIFVREVLTEWGFSALVDAGVLLAGELAANAVLHARTPYAVVVERTQEGVQVDVLDHSPAVVEVIPPDAGAAAGRGLHLVDAFASEWGATPEPELLGFAKGVRVALHP